MLNKTVSRACLPQDRRVVVDKFEKEYEKVDGELEKIPQDLVSLTIHTQGANSTMLMALVFDDNERAYALSLAEQLQVEYTCKTASEKTLANTAAAAHVMHLAYSRKLERQMQIKTIDSKRNGYIANLSKQADRAFRQYTQAIQLLKSLKQPNIKVTIAAKEAYVAQNQQINN